MTSRLSAWGTGIAKIEVEEWTLPDAVSYLFKESGRSDLTADKADAIATALGRLPLALSHAAAYLRENENATAGTYLAAITRHMREAPDSAEYGRAVFATFQEQAGQADARAPGARAVLSLAAFYAPDDIPEELFSQASAHFPPAQAQVAASPLELEKAIGALNRFSLIDFVPDTRTFSVHRLVQAAARDGLANEAPQWAQGALLAAFAAYPEPAFDTWPACERLTPHVRAVASHTTADSRELACLLVAAGAYLQERAALADVLPLYERSLAIRDRLAKADPGHAGWQGDLSVSHIKIGDVLQAQGNLPGALAAYEASLAIAERLAKADPGNAGWQRNLSVAHIKIGDVLQAQGNLPGALAAYETPLAIREILAKADTGNAGWQRELSVAQEKIGDVLQAQGNLPGALAAYEASLAIREILAKADTGNAGWQRDLSVSHDRIGDVLQAQGNLPGALAAYEASLAIAERLAKADPGNAGWQRDVAISNERLGDIYSQQENAMEARQAFERALGAYEALITRNPGDVPSQVYSVVPRWRLSRLDPKNARRHLEAALAILKPLAAANRLDANRLTWIGQMENELSEL